jgi:hypothetical protein
MKLIEKLKNNFPSYTIQNASAPHYTILHVYNRFVLDILSGVRPKYFIVSVGANEVISFIHHKKQNVQADLSHYYKPWISQAEAYYYLRAIPYRTILFVVAYLTYRRSMSSWEAVIEKRNEMTTLNARIKNSTIAREIFHTGFVTNTLSLMLATCRAFQIQLVLTTFATKASDMANEPRATYLWGIKRVNEEIRLFANKNNLQIIDFDRDCGLTDNDIENKWHFQNSGNKKRARLLTQVIQLQDTV